MGVLCKCHNVWYIFKDLAFRHSETLAYWYFFTSVIYLFDRVGSAILQGGVRNSVSQSRTSGSGSFRSAPCEVKFAKADDYAGKTASYMRYLVSNVGNFYNSVYIGSGLCSMYLLFLSQQTCEKVGVPNVSRFVNRSIGSTWQGRCLVTGTVGAVHVKWMSKGNFIIRLFIYDYPLRAVRKLFWYILRLCVTRCAIIFCNYWIVWQHRPFWQF